MLELTEFQRLRTFVPTQEMVAMQPTIISPSIKLYSRIAEPLSSWKARPANPNIARCRREAGRRISRKYFRMYNFSTIRATWLNRKITIVDAQIRRSAS
jgi:hypothetical protein